MTKLKDFTLADCCAVGMFLLFMLNVKNGDWDKAAHDLFLLCAILVIKKAVPA